MIGKRQFALAALAAGWLSACGGGTPAETSDAAPLFSCATETRAVPYAPNLTRTSATG